MSCSSQAWRTPFWSHKIHKISPLNPPKLLIFGESKEEALIYILTEAIYFPLSFAWGPLCLGFPCVPRPWFVYLISCYLLFDIIVLCLRASNSVVDACPKIVKAGSALRNPLMESELGLCGGSLHRRLGWAFVATTLLQCRCTSPKNEGTMGIISVSSCAPLSVTSILYCLYILYLA
jgi:hypothetical protein